MASSSGRFPEEEKNCDRLNKLINKVGQKTVRICFDQLIPPSGLNQHIRQHSKKLNELEKQNVLNQKQMKLLFPSTKSSDKFDITLMICLIRHTTYLARSKAFQWNEQPKSDDTSQAADLARIKYYRNKYSHMAGQTIANEEFKEICNDVGEAMNRLSNRKLEAEIKEAVSIEILSRKEVNELKETVPQNIKLQHDQRIKTWQEEDKKFIETQASNRILETFKNEKCITIKGNSGSGKSAIAHHIALQCCQQGYTIIPVESAKDIRDYGDPNKKQIFVFDDPAGKECLDRVKLNEIETYSDAIEALMRSEIKIIITCRKQVLNAKLFKHSITIINKKMYDLDKCPLLENEKRHMLEMYTKSNSIPLSNEIKARIIATKFINFPLLCRMFDRNERYQQSAEAFFINMFACLVKEMDYLKNNNTLQYCAVVLCMIFEDTFDCTYLDPFYRNNEDSRINHIDDIKEQCGLPRDFSRAIVASEMETLVGVYLFKEGNIFRFIHDSFYEAIAYHFGNAFPIAILKLSTSGFIREHVRVEKSDDDDHVIVIPSTHYKCLSERLIKDIANGNCHDVFLNPLIKNESFQNHFVQCLETLSADELITLFCKTQPCLQLFETVVWKTEYWRHRNYFKLHLLKDSYIRGIHWLLAENMSRLFNFVFIKLKDNCQGVESNPDQVETLSTALRLVTMACLGGNQEIVSMLLNDSNFGSIDDTCTTEDWGLSTLHLAVLSGNVSLVHFILDRGVEVDIANNKLHKTPLFYAAGLGFNDVCEALLNHTTSDDKQKNQTLNADVHKCIVNGVSPLYIAAQNGRHETIKLLLKYNADINKCMSNNASPLFMAAQNGHTETAKLLLQNKADENICMDYGISPLFIAAMKGHSEIVEMLLQYKAIMDIDWKDIGLSEEFVSTITGNMHVLECKLFQKPQTEPFECSKKGLTPLYIAAQNGDPTITRLLLNHEANVDQKWTEMGQTPLFAACGLGHTEVVKLLLDYKANTGICSSKTGNTPLIEAASDNRIDTVKLLLQSGADTSIKNNSGKSAEDVASQNGHHEIVNMLHEHVPRKKRKP